MRITTYLRFQLDLVTEGDVGTLYTYKLSLALPGSDQAVHHYSYRKEELCRQYQTLSVLKNFNVACPIMSIRPC